MANKPGMFPNVPRNVPVVQPPAQPAAVAPPIDEQRERKGVMGILTDPRTQMFLLSMAHALTRPRGFGETPVGQVLSGLMQGYQGLAIASELARRRRLEEQKAALEASKMQAETEKLRAETEARRMEAPANVAATSSLAEQRAAEAEKTREEARLLERQVNAQSIRAEAAKANVELQARELDQRAKQFEKEWMLKAAQFEELQRSNAERESLQWAELELKKAELAAKKALMEAQRARIAAMLKNGEDPRKIYSELVRAYMNAKTRMWTSTLKPLKEDIPKPGELAEEAFEYADSVMQDLGLSVSPVARTGIRPREGLTMTESQVEEFAKRRGIDPKSARSMLIQSGYSIVADRK